MSDMVTSALFVVLALSCCCHAAFVGLDATRNIVIAADAGKNVSITSGEVGGKVIIDNIDPLALQALVLSQSTTLASQAKTIALLQNQVALLNATLNVMQSTVANQTEKVGPTGSVGATGASGVGGALGPTGPQGVGGMQGATGARGVDGAVGPIGELDRYTSLSLFFPYISISVISF